MLHRICEVLTVFQIVTRFLFDFGFIRMKGDRLLIDGEFFSVAVLGSLALVIGIGLFQRRDPFFR